jgi:hypothetical protein
MDLRIRRCGPTQSCPPNHTLLDIRESICAADHAGYGPLPPDPKAVRWPPRYMSTFLLTL